GLPAIPSLEPAVERSGTFRLLQDAMSMLSRIDGKTDLRTMLGTEASTTASAKILYALLFAGMMDIRPPGETAPRPTAPTIPVPKEARPTGPPGATTEGIQKPFLFDLRKAEDLVRVVETGKIAARLVNAPIPASRAEAAAPQRPAPPPAAYKSDREIVLET